MSQDNSWYVRNIQGQHKGPLSDKDVIEHIRQGYFSGQESISRVGETRWFPITQYPPFFDALVESLNQEMNQVKDETTEIQGDEVSEQTEITGNKKAVVEKPLWQQIEEFHKQKKEEMIQFELERRQLEANTNSDIPASKAPTPPSQNIFAKFFNLFVIGGIAFVVIAVGMVFFSTTKPTKDRIRLRMVKMTGASDAPNTYDSYLKKAILHLLQHTIEDYQKAQELLATVIEKNNGASEAMELLCITYKELWPYSFQDSKDIDTIYSIFRAASVLQSDKSASGVCYSIYLVTVGEYEPAKNYMEDALRRDPGLLFFNQLMGDLLEQQQKYSTAIYYFQKVRELWSSQTRLKPWIKPILQEARTQRKLGRYAESLNAYGEALKHYPGHTLATMELGILEFQAFRHADKAVTYIQKALQSSEKFPQDIKAEAYYVMAQVSQLQGNKREALEYANKSFSIDSSNADVKALIVNLGGRSALESVQLDSSNMLYLGTLYMKLGNYFAAQAEFRSAFEADPTNALAAYHAGQSLWELNQSSEAIKWVERAIHADPGLVSAYVTLAEYYSFRYDYEGAAQILKNVQNRFPRNNEISRGFAKVEYLRGNFKSARSFAEKALSYYSMDVGAMQIITKANISLGDNQAALSSINKTLEIDPHSPENHCLYARVIANLHGPGAGIDYINRKIEESPDVIAYKKTLADIFIEEKNWSGARPVLQQIISMKKDDKPSILSLAMVYKQEGYVNRALEMYLTAASLDPLDPTPLFLAGELYMGAGNYTSAQAQFSRVLKINKRFPKVYYNLGKAALESKDFTKALEMAQMEQHINPNIAESYLLAAEAYYRMGQYSSCATEYQKAIPKRPQTADIYINLARCYRLSGALESAVTMLDQAAQKESGHPDIYKELGATFHMQGLLVEAYTAYERYLALAPNAPDRGDIERIMKELQ
ncbi:MAG: tetratricopeptide repeat protein [Bdellovibrionales bacterium]|nr:tetratricopeptide repeat protein [Bdellovibrionales bacterium]